MDKVTQRESDLYQSLEPVVTPLGVDLVDVAIKTHEDVPVVEVVIDSEEGVGSSTCAKVSQHVSPILDMEDLQFRESYELVVTSPGLERTLRRESELDRFSGRDVEIKCYAPYEERKLWEGTLKGFEGGDVLLEREKKETARIPSDKIASVKLTFDAEEALKKSEEPDNNR
ncbi:MAG: ribosome maturation factor RimP [bacterium]